MSQAGERLSADPHQVQPPLGPEALAQVGEHQLADAGSLLGRFPGVLDVAPGIAAAFELFEGDVEIAGHGRELVVEVMGDGRGHPGEAFRLLGLPELGLQPQALFLSVGSLEYEPDPMSHGHQQVAVGPRKRGHLAAGEKQDAEDLLRAVDRQPGGTTDAEFLELRVEFGSRRWSPRTGRPICFRWLGRRSCLLCSRTN